MPLLVTPKSGVRLTRTAGVEPFFEKGCVCCIFRPFLNGSSVQQVVGEVELWKSLRNVTCGQNKMPLLRSHAETQSCPAQAGRPGVDDPFFVKGRVGCKFRPFLTGSSVQQVVGEVELWKSLRDVHLRAKKKEPLLRVTPKSSGVRSTSDGRRR